MLLFIDTESTGLHPLSSLCQVACLVDDSSKIVNTFSCNIQPFEHTIIETQALSLLNVTEKDLWSYPCPHSQALLLAQFFYQYLDKDICLVGHSVQYDVAALCRFFKHICAITDCQDSRDLFEKIICMLHDCSLYCTFLHAKQLRLPVMSYALLSLAQYFHCHCSDQIHSLEIHTAINDCTLTRCVYYCLEQYILTKKSCKTYGSKTKRNTSRYRI